MRASFRLILALTACAALWPPAAEAAGGVEVVEVKGIIDGSVERTVMATLEAAARDRDELVVLQIDSAGVVDARRTRRLVEAVRGSQTPVAAWIGPPGAEARNGAALLVHAADVAAVSPLSSLGAVRTMDLRDNVAPTADDLTDLEDERERLVRAATVLDLLEQIDGREVESGGEERKLNLDPEQISIRFHKLDLFGRALHAAAQPSIVYLLLLMGLVGVVFELFHPSTGPAGVAGLAGLALGMYGFVTLGGSWLGLALLLVGVAGFCVDLRYEGLGLATAAGLAGLIAGSLLLFRGPWLRVSPWVLAFGIVGMVLFLLGAMTRVLRDLRAIARGELEVTDAHPHPEGNH